MRIIPSGVKYNSKVYVLDKEKLICKLDCECQDFQFRRIKKVGEGVDIKLFYQPCKHLRPVVEALEKIGYTLKKPKEPTGDTYLKPKLKRELMQRANNSCEQMITQEGVLQKCSSTDRLECHRKSRGSNSGLYSMENCIILCWPCHKGKFGLHSNEFRGCQGK